jgi:hypothetical protein
MAILCKNITVIMLHFGSSLGRGDSHKERRLDRDTPEALGTKMKSTYLCHREGEKQFDDTAENK